MPVFLKSIGFSVMWIGILEGLAEAVAGISKGYFGNLSDAYGRRVPFVRLGYFLSAISKPLMAVSVYPLWIFFARLTDRIGKGIRTAPRDAILSSEATPQTKGEVFGFHRSMDTLGAVIGPLIALVYLFFNPGDYTNLFLFAFIPGAMAVVFTFLIKDANDFARKKDRVSFFSFVKYWTHAPAAYRRLTGGLLFFACLNSSDLFLILRARESGLPDTYVIGIYVFYNLVYAIAAYPLGKLADKVGLFMTIMAGLIVFALVYGGMALNGSVYWYAFLFLMYGIYAACSEGISKALISNIATSSSVATALGTFNAFQSVASLFASAIAGFVWYSYGPGVLFTGVASLIVLLICYFVTFRRSIVTLPE